MSRGERFVEVKFYPNGKAEEIIQDSNITEKEKLKLIEGLGSDGGVFLPVEKTDQDRGNNKDDN